MTDKEMLQAMSDMLQPILENIKEMKTDISELKTKVSNLEEKVSGLEAGQKSLEQGQKNLEAGQKEIKEIVKLNYDKTEDFFVRQMEHNTEVSDKIDRFAARQEIFENQTIKNTAELRRIK